MKHIIWPSELADQDVGYKAKGLAELQQQRIQVAPFFVVTGSVFEEMAGEVMPRIKNLLTTISDQESLEANATIIQRLVAGLELPADLKEELIEAYEVLEIDFENVHISDMVKELEDPIVAVRVSTSDSGLSSMLSKRIQGQLVIKGTDALRKALHGVWVAQFFPEIINYKRSSNLDPLEPISIMVQKVIKSNRSCRTETMSQEQILVEAMPGSSWGVKDEEIGKDRFIVASKGLELKESTPGRHTKRYHFDPGSLSFLKQEGISLKTINDKEAVEAARVTKNASAILNSPVSLTIDIQEDLMFVTDCTPLESYQMPLKAFTEERAEDLIHLEEEPKEEEKDLKQGDAEEFAPIEHEEDAEKFVPIGHEEDAADEAPAPDEDFLEVSTDSDEEPEEFIEIQGTKPEETPKDDEYVELQEPPDEEQAENDESSIITDFMGNQKAMQELSKAIRTFEHSIVSALKETSGSEENQLEDLLDEVDIEPELKTRARAVKRLADRYRGGETLTLPEMEFALKAVREILDGL